METEEIISAEVKELLPVLPQDAVSFVKIEAMQLNREIHALKISNREQYEKAVSLGLSNKNVIKRIETFKKAIVQPLKIQVKNIESMFQKIISRFEANDSFIREAMEKYQSKVKIEGIKTIHTQEGHATIQKRMDYEIVDDSQIPREWLCPDTTKIGRAVRSRVIQDIPGIRIFETKTTSFTV